MKAYKIFVILLIIILLQGFFLSAINAQTHLSSKTLEEQIEHIRITCNLNPDSTLKIIDQYLFVTDSLQLRDDYAELLRLKGLAYFYIGNMSLAHELFVKSRDLFISTSNIDGEADALNNISVIHSQLGYYQTSFEMDSLILELRKQSGDLKKLAYGYNNIAVSYLRQKKYEKALEHFQKSIEICTGLGDFSSIDLSYNNIGNIFRLNGQADSAFYYFNKSLEYSIPQNHKQIMSNSYVYLGDYYWKNNQILKAKNYFQKGLDLALETGIIYEVEWAAQFLNQVQAKLGDYENAYKNLLLQKQMADSCRNIELIEKIAQIGSETKFEKEREIDRIKLEKAQLENLIEINKQKQERDLAIIVGVALFLVAIFLYRNYREKTRDNVLLKKQKDEISAQKEEIQQQRDRINELNKTKDKFFAIIAHDLKNPLGGMVNLSETIYHNFEHIGAEKMIVYLRSIKDSLKSVFSLLENLLQWSSLQLGNIKPKPELFDLNQIMNENRKLLSLFSEQKNIAIRWEGEGRNIVYADPSMTNTIVRNLLTNAIKFTPKNGLITLEVTNEESCQKVSITDTGIGIAAEEIPALFTLKTNKESRPKSKDAGIGLGLILCKEFTQLNGGQIGVESQLGKGSKFWFSLPASES